ncbi:transcriptional regulator NrdR [Candidatus Woesearchaeota archaeon CG10_big_fil_rev_8_21_14_0_10_32_9]|nr:MAG: transcriptional regulator NrdR [Candidatus Woesearchaeota archaeon CG10_big_fil_rev_8_21_14_0_10_32_9]
MKCPFCNHNETKVLETRETEEDITRRRRECLKCEKRFTTYEQVELTNIILVKKDGRREIFDRQKLIRSMQLACQKRPISQEKVDDVASKIESKIRNSMEKEITTKQVGELVMKYLKKVDQIAYIRFASVYREFEDLDSFKKEVELLNKKN